jgi:tetratricopeptide (TPR) repeat protein
MVGNHTEPGSDLPRDLIESAKRHDIGEERFEEIEAVKRALADIPAGREDEATRLWQRLGNAYFEAGDFERTVDALERVVSAGGASVVIYERLARCARDLQKFSDEVRYREAAVDRRPDDPVLWRDLGIARRRAGASRDAVTSLREAMRLDAEDEAGSGIELGRALRDLGEAENAVAAFREALARRPDCSDLWSELAVAYSELGLFAESDQAVREAIRLKPANAAAWRTIATNALKRGTRDTAAKAYQRMKELNPDFADEILSWVSSTAGLPPDALGEPDLAAAPAAFKRRGRLLPFRRLRA